MLAPINLLAAALLAPAASATCDQDSVLMWTQPSNAEYAFAPDTVFRALVGEGDSPADAYSVRLLSYGQPVEATVEVTEHPGEDAYETRYLHTLVPVEPLAEGARYSFEVVHESGDAARGRTVSTLVEAVDEVGVPGTPAVVVATAYDDEGEGETSCDYGQVRTFELSLAPAVADETGRSVLHLYRLKSEADTWHYVRAYRVPEDGSALELDAIFDRRLDWGDCFVAVQEDIHGNQSAPSPMACAADPLLATEEDPMGADGAEPVDSSPRGCTSAGALSGWAALWLATLLAVSRRER